MSRNRLVNAFELVFGVILGAPAAAFAVFMLPNIEMIASEQHAIDSLTLSNHLKHFTQFGSQIVGYLSLLVAFFLKPVAQIVLRSLLLVGLSVGIVSSIVYTPVDFGWLWRDLVSLQLDGYTGSMLFFLIYSLLLAAAGVSLFIKHAQTSVFVSKASIGV